MRPTTHLLPVVVALVIPAVVGPVATSTGESSAFARCYRVSVDTEPHPTEVQVCTP